MLAAKQLPTKVPSLQRTESSLVREKLATEEKDEAIGVRVRARSVSEPAMDEAKDGVVHRPTAAL